MKYTTIAVVIGISAASAACDRDREVVKETEGLDEEATRNEPPERQAVPPAADQPAAREQQPVRGGEEAEDAAELVQEAAATLRKMKADPELKKLLNQSSGVFIVPEYGRAAAGVGARGGEGVLVAQQNGQWSAPVFYDIGGISIGAQAGAEGGEIAMLLMSEQALNSFKGDNTFSLNADANLTLVDYSGLSQASLGKDAGHVIFWSDTEGLFAGVALGATDISWDDDENPAYYGKAAAPQDVLSGKIQAPTKNDLQQELSDM